MRHRSTGLGDATRVKAALIIELGFRGGAELSRLLGTRAVSEVRHTRLSPGTTSKELAACSVRLQWASPWLSGFSIGDDI